MARKSVPAAQAPPATPSRRRTGWAALDKLTETAPHGVVDLPVDRLHPHPDNPRRDLGDLSELTASIAAQGVLQPLTVVPAGDDGWRIVIGHRRAAAATVAGLGTVPCTVVDMSPAVQLATMLAENLHRTQLSPIEEATGYQGMLDLGTTIDAAADLTGRSTTTVRSRIRLLGLPDDVRARVHDGQATLTDAAALADLEAQDGADELLLVRLEAALGTPSFAREMSYARSRLEQTRRVAPMLAELVAALREAGLQPIDDDGDQPGSPRWFVCSTELEERSGDYAALLAALAAGEVPRSWVFRAHSRSLGVYGPIDEDAAEDEDDRAEREHAAREAERELKERIDRQKELAAAAQAARRDFLRGLLTCKRLTQAQTDALAGYVAAELICGLPLTEDEQAWFGVDPAAVRAAADDDDGPDAIDGAFTKAAAAMPSTLRLLAAAAAGAEPIVHYPHLTRSGAWYGLLLALGYVPSDEERAAVWSDEARRDGGAS